jgi:release factor glutamine methyltransferase
MNCSEKLENTGLLELIAWGREELLRAGIEEAQEECERVLMKLLGCTRSELYLKQNKPVVSKACEQFIAILQKRITRIPLVYLLKETDFWKETLYVDERCLIPRPETEILVETVIREIKKFNKTSRTGLNRPYDFDKKRDLFSGTFSFLDIGTGSGAIAIAILRACKNSKGTLLDISGDALEVARKNVEKYGLGPVIARSPAVSGATRQSVSKAGLLRSARNDNESRSRLVQGDLFEPFAKDEKWDLIVSNPPYLSQADWNGVQEELQFEPRGALDGGKDGLNFYKKIIASAKSHLTLGGLLALEVGEGQIETVSTWLQTAGYDNIHRFRDYLGIERVVIARFS